MLGPAIAMPAVTPVVLLTVTVVGFVTLLVLTPVRLIVALAKEGSNTRLLLITGAAEPAPLITSAPSLKLLMLPMRSIPPEMLLVVWTEFTELLPVSVCGVLIVATPAGLNPARLVSGLTGAAAINPLASVP